MRELLNLLGAQVVAVQIQVMFRTSVRRKVNRVAVPHGKRIRPIRVGHILDGVVLQVVD